MVQPLVYCSIDAGHCVAVGRFGALVVLAIQEFSKVLDRSAQAGTLACVVQPVGHILSRPLAGLC